MIPYLHSSRPELGPLTPEQRSLAAELRRDVEVLATDIGPRGTFAPGRYRLAEEFITTVLRRCGYGVKRQTWTAMGVECANLEVTIRGTGTPERSIVVEAHYDSVEECPAANDNGSGVAGLLAMARRLADARPASSIRLVFFANEEPPFFNLDEMGSQIYARACRKAGEQIAGMFCLETIGCFLHEPGSQRWPRDVLGLLLPTVGDFISFAGPGEAETFLRMCAGVFEKRGTFPLLAAAVPSRLVGQIDWSDHRGFNEVGYPAFMVTDTAPMRYEHYHLPTDTPDRLDYDSMARVVDGLVTVAATVADAA